MREKVGEAEDSEDYLKIKEWIEDNAPGENSENYDHVPNLLEQLSREPHERPDIQVANKSIDDLEYEDFELESYNPHSGLEFGVAE